MVASEQRGTPLPEVILTRSSHSLHGAACSGVTSTAPMASMGLCVRGHGCAQVSQADALVLDAGVSFIPPDVCGGSGHLRDVAHKTKATYCKSKMSPSVPEVAWERKRNFRDSLERKRKLKV